MRKGTVCHHAKPDLKGHHQPPENPQVRAGRLTEYSLRPRASSKGLVECGPPSDRARGHVEALAIAGSCPERRKSLGHVRTLTLLASVKQRRLGLVSVVLAGATSLVREGNQQTEDQQTDKEEIRCERATE